MKYKRFIIMLIDGVPADEMERLMSEGELPIIAKLKNEGTYFKDCITSFPSLTGPSHVPFYLDKHPSDIDFTGHNQFDRINQEHENYLKNYRLFPKKLKKLKTIYSEFADPVSVAEPVGKYEASYIRNPFGLLGWMGVPWINNAYALWQTRQQYKEGRDLITTWLHDTDAYQHIHKKPQAFIKSLKQIDKFLAKFTEEIDDDTNIVLVTDHGMEPAKWGRSTLVEMMRYKGINASNSRVYLDGGGMIQLFLKYPKKSWSYKPTIDELRNWPTKQGPWNLLDFIGQHPETEFAMAGDEEHTYIESRYGSAVIKEEGDKLLYKPTRGNDLFGYKYDKIAHEAVGRPISFAESLALTVKTNYPDAIYQAHMAMQAPSVANVIITITAGYSPNLLTRCAVHGGLRAIQMKTFALFTKPLNEEVRPIRTHEIPKLIRKYKA
ncbi:alkaline phosphatase family protein [Patescibacteria group bacterium]